MKNNTQAHYFPQKGKCPFTERCTENCENINFEGCISYLDFYSQDLEILSKINESPLWELQ